MSRSDDTTRTMALLWRNAVAEPAPASPGPRPRLELDQVVAAAVAAADANPSVGLSMRAVGERLGVTAMALYGYVPGKDALVALAYDAIHAEIPDHAQGGGAWRRQTIDWAEDLVDLYMRHAWALRVSYARPVLGPNEQGVLESLVGILRGTDLGPERLRHVIGLVFHAVRGTALTIAEAREAEDTSGIGEAEWWHTSTTALDEVVPDFADRFPNTMWLLSHPSDMSGTVDRSSYVERHARVNLRAGLDMLLDGVEAATTSTQQAR